MNNTQRSFTVKYNTSRNKAPRQFKKSRRYNNKRKSTRSTKKIDTNRFVNKIDHDRVQEVREYTPSNVYKDFSFHPQVKQAINNKGYEVPTEIQDRAIPVALEGRDIVGLSGTGTGKTAAFLLPILNRLFEKKTKQALILSPTRELAIQIDKELHGLHERKMGIFSTVIVGGVPAWRQIKQLKKGKQHVIVGTPGRVIDLVNRGVLDLSSMDTVVLDEADRMLDMGFIDDIRYILEHVPTKRHTMLFSATMSDTIMKLVDNFLKEPEVISIAQQDPSVMVDQDIYALEGKSRIDALIEYIDTTDYEKMIIFAETKRAVEMIADRLQKNGEQVDYLHGDKDHRMRQRTLNKFIHDEIDILVATDVAGRGIDIKGITHVVNYEAPQDYETYIHRIGRTGRAGTLGKAVTLTN